MDNKDKLLLIFYTNPVNPEYFNELNTSIKQQISGLTSELDDIIFFVLPDYSLIEGTVKLECLNPKLIEQQNFENLNKVLDEISRNIKIPESNDSK